MEIISLHFPKTAGTSFSKSLEDNYGHKLLKDYHNLDVGEYDLDRYTIVHGHLHISKYYKLYPNAKVITWLRNPLDRIVSYYNFWKKHPKLDNNKWYIKFTKEKPTFREFLENWDRIPREFEAYTNDFNHKNFYFVGITERYNKDIEIIGEKLNWEEITKYNENITHNTLSVSDKDIKLFNDIYKNEIEIYNYFKNKQ